MARLHNLLGHYGMLGVIPNRHIKAAVTAPQPRSVFKGTLQSQAAPDTPTALIVAAMSTLTPLLLRMSDPTATLRLSTCCPSPPSSAVLVFLFLSSLVVAGTAPDPLPLPIFSLTTDRCLRCRDPALVTMTFLPPSPSMILPVRVSTTLACNKAPSKESSNDPAVPMAVKANRKLTLDFNDQPTVLTPPPSVPVRP